VNHPAQIPIGQLLEDCEIKRTRGSGPGGQHRNKVETAIVVEHLPSGLRGEASERRSQPQNRKMAIHRLRIKLALSVRHPSLDACSPLWLKRAQGGRISVSSQHEDFPALLAEALDVISGQGFAIPPAAEKLGVSASQLIKFLKVDSNGLLLVNQERKQRGESPLH